MIEFAKTSQPFLPQLLLLLFQCRYVGFVVGRIFCKYCSFLLPQCRCFGNRCLCICHCLPCCGNIFDKLFLQRFRLCQAALKFWNFVLCRRHSLLQVGRSIFTIAHEFFKQFFFLLSFSFHFFLHVLKQVDNTTYGVGRHLPPRFVNSGSAGHQQRQTQRCNLHFAG